MSRRNFGTTDYKTAVKWLGNDFVLCNTAVEIDFAAWDNCDLCKIDNEFYQFYLTDATEREATRLRAMFGLDFIYSEKFDAFILCVPHWGTSWDSVEWPIYDKTAADCIKDRGLEFKH